MKQINTKHIQGRLRSAGFTLIELLVVMAVMMILMGILLKGYSFMSGESKAKTAYAKMARIAIAMDEYFRDTGQYTDNISLLVPKYLDSGDLMDPWGSPFTVSMYGSGIGGFNTNDRQRSVNSLGPFGISSTGPNRIPDSVHVGRDDLSWPSQ